MARDKCPNCGATLRKNAKHCTVCGRALTPEARVTPQSYTPSPSIRKCPRCGNTLKGSEEFCTKCGIKLVSVTSPPISEGGPICGDCGYSRNPIDAVYCIRCGQALTGGSEPKDAGSAEEVPVIETPAQPRCPNCNNVVRPDAKFCIFCGFNLTDSSIEEEPDIESKTEQDTEDSTEIVESAEAIPVPAEVLEQLMARGHQIALEEQYAKSGDGSEELLERLGDTAESGIHPLEELLDTYIRERGEQERLDELHEKGEVTDRVYERLNKEYDQKLSRIDEEIQTGIAPIKGYLTHLRSDKSAAQDQLETVETRIQIGDIEGDPEKEQTTLKEKIQRLSYAITAVLYMLKKEASLHGAPPTRFEVTETSLADFAIEKTESDEASESKESEEESAGQEKPETEAGKICNQCGRVSPSDSKFCTFCGSPL